MTSIRYLAVAMLAAAGTFAPGQAHALTEEDARKTEWFRILHDAKMKNGLACAGAGEDAACAAEIAGIEAAMAAPDATDAVRHMLSQQLLDAMRIRGTKLLDKREYDRAAVVLDDANARMFAHFDGGKHWHVLLDSVGLMNQVAILRVRQKRWDDASEVARLARTATDRAWNAWTNSDRSEDARKRFRRAIVDAEEFENTVADAYEDMAQLDSKSAKMLHERAYEAYGRAAEWTVRADEFGAARFAAARADVRFARAKVDQGRMASRLGRGDDARAHYDEAMAFACAKPDPSSPHRNRLDDEHLARLCERAAQLDFLQSPEYRKAFDAAFNDWYDAQVKALGN